MVNMASKFYKDKLFVLLTKCNYPVASSWKLENTPQVLDIFFIDLTKHTVYFPSYLIKLNMQIHNNYGENTNLSLFLRVHFMAGWDTSWMWLTHAPCLCLRYALNMTLWLGCIQKVSLFI